MGEPGVTLVGTEIRFAVLNSGSRSRNHGYPGEPNLEPGSDEQDSEREDPAVQGQRRRIVDTGGDFRPDLEGDEFGQWFRRHHEAVANEQIGLNPSEAPHPDGAERVQRPREATVHRHAPLETRATPAVHRETVGGRSEYRRSQL